MSSAIVSSLAPQAALGQLQECWKAGEGDLSLLPSVRECTGVLISGFGGSTM